MTNNTVQNNPPGLYILVSASDGVFITSPSSFFRPKLPLPISETKEDCVTLLNSWIANEKAVAFRWNSTSKTEWNLFSYSKDFTDGDGQHIFKSGVVNCFSESSKEISAERNKLLLKLHGKELLKTTAAKKAYSYPTSKCPTPGIRKSPRKSVNGPSVQQSKEVSAVKQKTVPVKSKSTSLAKPKAAVPSTVPLQQKASESLVPAEKQGVKRKLQYPESSDSNSDEEKEKDDDCFGSIHSTSSQSREIADVSPSNEHQKETEQVLEDQVFVIIGEKENSGALPSGSDNVPNLDCKDIIIEELKKENESLREQNRVLDQKVTDYYNTIASKEFENIELREKIEGLEKEEPIVLAREMKETLEGMKSLVGIMSSPAVHISQLNVQQPPGLGVPSQYFSSPSSSSCHIGAKLVKLWGEVFVCESVPKKVKTILKSSGQTEFSRNRAVTVILENLFSPEQLANMSLSGRKSPGIPDAIPKPKIPDKIQEAIHNFMQAAWDESFSIKDEKGSVTTMAVLSTTQINKAIGARLLACHTHLKKKKNPQSQEDHE